MATFPLVTWAAAWAKWQRIDALLSAGKRPVQAGRDFVELNPIWLDIDADDA